MATTNAESPKTPEMDFFADLSEMFRDALISAGYAVGGTETPEEICRTYHRVDRRRIRPSIRQVLLSREFRCPPAYQAGFDLIRSKAQSGDTLKPHQTRLLKYSEKDDALLKDWGIHHLHLGTTIESDGYVSRTPPVLFARVTDDALYCINILDHGAFEDIQLLQILHYNWPDSLARFQIHGIQLEQQFTAQDIKQLRKAGIQGFYQMPDGTLYGPVGGGIATSTASLQDVLACDRVHRTARAVEAQVLEQYKRDITLFGGASRLRLRRDADTHQVILVDEETGTRFLTKSVLEIAPLCD
jgi:hypothetical protein